MTRGKTKSDISLCVEQNQGEREEEEDEKRVAGHRNINVSVEVLQKRAGGKIERPRRKR